MKLLSELIHQKEIKYIQYIDYTQLYISILGCSHDGQGASPVPGGRMSMDEEESA